MMPMMRPHVAGCNQGFAVDLEPNKSTSFVLQQDVSCGDCICAPPMALCQKNNIYRIIERKSGQEVGKLAEDSSFCSRCCCFAEARPMKSNIEFFGRTGY